MTLDRLIYGIVLVALMGCGALVVLNFQVNPMDAQREWLASEIANIDENPVELQDVQYDYANWQQSIDGNNYLWRELIEAPKPNPDDEARRRAEEERRRALAARPKEPNIDELLKGVLITRARVGNKARVILPEYPRGVFFGS